MALPPSAQNYLRRLHFALAELSANERDEIVAEIQTHFQERQAQGKQNMLEGFESPEDYAARFIAERALTGALVKGTSVALGRSLLISRLSAVTNYLLVVPIFLIQLFAILLLFAATIKPILPNHVGLFLDYRGEFSALGVVGGLPEGSREIWGWWTIPIFVGAGLLLLWCSNRILRKLAQWRLKRITNK